VLLALWPARSALYYAVAYLGMSVCALVTLLCVERPLRWVAIVALLLGLTGIFISWPSQMQHSSSVQIPAQTPPAGGSNWIQWSSTVGGNNHYYALTPFATNWNAAESLAVSWGGNLATITSSQQQNFINDTFLTGDFEYRPLWIGLVRASTNGTGNLAMRLRRAVSDLGFHVDIHPYTEFEWVTGEDFSYSNWKPGEPNNTAPGESWVALNWQYSKYLPGATKGDWNDAPLNGTSGYGGNTDGPYFGLVELGRPPWAILTPSLGALITLAVLALAAGLAFVSIKMRSSRRAQE
jgi:hypothetical protein